MSRLRGSKKGAALSELHPIMMVQITSSGDSHAATSSDDANGASGASTRR
jgi:hypothetical protein